MSSDLTSIYYQRNLNAPNLDDNLTYEFERFRLDASRRMLYENNQPVQLAPKVIETLIALVRQRGEIISKEKLMREVWSDSFVEDSNLTQNIYLLRKTLGKGADGRDLIETFRRRGYLFTGEIKENGERETESGFFNDECETPKIVSGDVHDQTQASAEKPTAQQSKSGKYFAAAMIAGAILLAAIFAALRLYNTAATQEPQNQVAAAQSLKNTRITPDRNILSAAFTPDGKYLVYTIQEKGKHSVWLKDLATESETQIRPAIKESYSHIIVSRDKFLYYSTGRENSPNGTIVRAPINGGAEQIVARDVTSPFTLSPDEKQLAFTNGKFQLMIAETNADDRQPKILATRDGEKKWFESWSSRLSWSPDGASIVICGARKDEKGKIVRELIEISVKDGAEKIIPTPEDWNYLDDAVWLGDKSAVMVTARETAAAPFQIWRIAYPSGDVRRITSDSNAYADLNISPDSRRLVVIKHFGNLNLWTAPMKEISKIRQITFGSAAFDGLWGIAFAPDGKIIYTSPRGGNFDVWQTDAVGGGGEQKQLTKNAGDWNGRPQITADGRYIVFTSTRSGTRQIWRTDADGSNPTQLTEEPLADEASVTANGEQIYFTGKVDEKSYISKISIDGGKAVRISPPSQNFFMPSVSPDGKLIFCALHDQSSTAPWKSALIDAETGDLVRVFDFVFGTARWTTDSKSVIYSLGTENLWQISIDGNAKPQPITDFESGTIRTFALSPDSRQIAFSRGNSTNEAVLLENF